MNANGFNKAAKGGGGAAGPGAWGKGPPAWLLSPDAKGVGKGAGKAAGGWGKPQGPQADTPQRDGKSAAKGAGGAGGGKAGGGEAGHAVGAGGQQLSYLASATALADALEGAGAGEPKPSPACQAALARVAKLRHKLRLVEATADEGDLDSAELLALLRWQLQTAEAEVAKTNATPAKSPSQILLECAESRTRLEGRKDTVQKQATRANQQLAYWLDQREARAQELLDIDLQLERLAEQIRVRSQAQVEPQGPTLEEVPPEPALPQQLGERDLPRMVLLFQQMRSTHISADATQPEVVQKFDHMLATLTELADASARNLAAHDEAAKAQQEAWAQAEAEAAAQEEPAAQPEDGEEEDATPPYDPWEDEENLEGDEHHDENEDYPQDFRDALAGDEDLEIVHVSLVGAGERKGRPREVDPEELQRAKRYASGGVPQPAIIRLDGQGQTADADRERSASRTPRGGRMEKAVDWGLPAGYGFSAPRAALRADW